MLIDILLFLLLLVTAALTGTALMHLFLRIPFVPSSKRSIEEMIRHAALKGNETVYDLGSGDGRLLIDVKRQYPKTTVIGVEYVPTIWLLGKTRCLFARADIRYERGNALRRDVSDADIVFLYLLPPLMGRLEEKFDRELRPGTKVISNTFPFPQKKHVAVSEVQTRTGKKKVWVYEW